MIYELKDDDGKSKDEFVISSHGTWIPGVFASHRAANYAFRLNPQQQHDLWEKHRPEAVTFEQIQEFRRKHD